MPREAHIPRSRLSPQIYVSLAIPAVPGKRAFLVLSTRLLSSRLRFHKTQIRCTIEPNIHLMSCLAASK